MATSTPSVDAATAPATSPGLKPPVAALPFARLNPIIRGERPPADALEANAVLFELAKRKSGRLPAAWLVEVVLAATADSAADPSGAADWASRRGALDAVLRRVGFAARDGLAVVSRPPGQVFGRYRLAGSAGRGPQKKTEQRPYDVRLYALTPLRASCDCADYLRGSLGVCKHVLVVLEDVAIAQRGAQPGEPLPVPWLSWDPVRPWRGAGDRLGGVRLAGPPPVGVEAHFDAGRPRAEVLADLDRRRQLIEGLVADARAADAEPAALALLRDELGRVERRRAGRAYAPTLMAALGSLRRPLYPYQREGVARFLEEQRLLLADDMGLGKTTQAIAACHVLFQSGRVRRGLLIVPAALEAQWQREWEATTDRVPLQRVEGGAAERARLYAEATAGVLLTHYELLLRDLPHIQRFAPELVVLDEAQRIKNWASKSSAYVMTLAPEWRLVLTGTPMENRLEELATLLDWVDDTALAPKWRLAPWHTAWGEAGERAGARHLDTLRERLAPCLLRRIRREVLRELPPRSDARLPVEMTDQQREEHDARIVPIAQLLAAGRQRPLRQAEFARLMQLLAQQRIVSNGLALLRFDEMWPAYAGARADDGLLASTCSPKLGELRGVIRQLVLEQGRKVVVFSQWRKMLRLAEWAVRDLLEDHGLSSAFFTGQESQAQRTRNVAALHDDPSVRVLFLSDAGGVGLNLQRAASACVNLELPWNPAVLEQRIGRIYRLGQEEPIDVINLVTEHGIEARIAGLVGHKRALFDGLFDGTTDAVRFDAPATFFGEIERLVDSSELPELPELPADGGDLASLDDELDELDAVDVSAASREPSSVAASEPVASEPAASEPAAPARLDIPALFERVQVARTADGGLRIDAPPGVAEELLALLEGLGALARSTRT
jgi:SNF2 domain-containing protein/helicase-like protein